MLPAEPFHIPGFRIISSDEHAIVLKCEPSDERDNFDNELRTGLLLNTLRDKCPNFVFTYGMKTIESTRYLFIEYIPGLTIGYYKDNFLELIGYIIQVLLAITIANKTFGFTHYNLHRQNVVMKPLRKKRWIKYELLDETIYVETDHIPVIIDFGRSYTHKYGGHTLEVKGVYPKENILHDSWYFLYSVLSKTFPDELKIILDWYNLPLVDHPYKITELTCTKEIPVLDFIRKCEEHFGYKLTTKTRKILKPQ